jgi:hypothetical protein
MWKHLFCNCSWWQDQQSTLQQEVGNAETSFLLKVYFRKHTGSLEDQNMDAQCGTTMDNTDFWMGYMFWITA